MKKSPLRWDAICWFVTLCMLVQQTAFGQNDIETGTLKVDAFDLNYIIEGEGRSAIVIGSAKYYDRVFSKHLRKQLRLTFLDHRGFVPAPDHGSIQDYSLDKILDDIEKARAQLQLGKVMIIGHSGHSYMALEYAKKYPQNVTHVVMICISPDLGDETERLIEQKWHESVDPVRQRALEDNKLRITNEMLAELTPGEVFIQTYVRNGPMAWYDPHFDSTPLWEGVTINAEMFGYMWGHVFREIDITQGLTDFKKPVFLALGRYDYLVGPPSMWDPIRPLFQDLTVRVFEKSGHTPPLEQPELFDRALLEWLVNKTE